MPIPLSNRTVKLLESCFLLSQRKEIETIFLNEVSETIPFCNHSTPEEMERIRFSIIKLTLENEINLAIAVDNAKRDWRDLFMMAGFGYNANEHLNWYLQVINQKPDV